ncbi:hypothetical protein FW755_04095 [Lonepinella koalarum]|uniref:PTS cellobiose transporter subunit IIA n=1 Tax=Lonepinella koalarum TaxID=53417 RepID=A0A4V2PUQ8_9PAST|nr:hypothetical protein [Lonepinella koalarum]MDH2926230.1 hypothetical protein [Lonepinella koalarum]TCK71381.1 hypothetical protein EV692_0451 [Lonepinella koalarum]TFJ91093.1 hypothetical protein E0709_02245 [Lonepinella koalarum]TYG34324.1 hypothetical protein FW755_04095 [Lonepinella koalarum]
MSTLSHRQQMTLRSLYFNRFLWVRYAAALLFFTTLLWTCAMWLSQASLLVIPAVLLLLLGTAYVEQVRLYYRHNAQAPWTYAIFKLLLISHVGLLGLLFTPYAKALFPFVRDPHSIVLVGYMGIAILLISGVLRKLYRIRTNQDSHYHHIIAYQKQLNLKGDSR